VSGPPIFACVIASVALLGCSRIDIPLALTIRSPAEGATLIVGQSFRVVADSDVDQPTGQAWLFQIELTHPSTGYEMTWQVRSSSESVSHILDENLLVPPDAPPGDDYRLSVTFQAEAGQSEGLSYAFSDRIRVRVAAAP